MITPAELEHLAVLSRIKLTEEDKKSLIKEFDSILGYVDQLKKVEEPKAETGEVTADRRPESMLRGGSSYGSCTRDWADAGVQCG